MADKGLTSKDIPHLEKCLKARESIEGPRIGDFVVVPWALGPMRFSHDWGEKIQISKGGSFHLSSSGGVSFSGGLEPGIDKSKLRLAYTEPQQGLFWIWKEGFSGAGRGVNIYVECRTYFYNGDKP